MKYGVQSPYYRLAYSLIFFLSLFLSLTHKPPKAAAAFLQMHHSIISLTSAAKEPFEEKRGGGEGEGGGVEGKSERVLVCMRGLQEASLALFKRLLAKTEAEERERERERKAKALFGKEGGEREGEGGIGGVRETLISSFGSFVSYFAKATDAMAAYLRGISLSFTLSPSID